jgi:uncharacterized cupredoxin-like copper-binding protein
MKKLVIAGSIAAVIGTTVWAHSPMKRQDGPMGSGMHRPMHDGGHHGHSMTQASAVKTQMDWGIAGEASQVSRTIRVVMSDDMRFSPSQLTIKKGETIRFEVVNNGRVLHEMVIGTKKELDDHAEMMKKHPNMEHDEAYMAHVDPGQTAEIIWLFNREGAFDFACLIPGHYSAGMVGKIKVTS